ncbi:hypothetical protein PQX77_013525 [Marasmius sp. AFHP31]|nr:hypothetical protein PQX77_013525 [Marasmius sp. AFHP31]
MLPGASLPFELIILILESLPNTDTTTLASCALVCRSWVPISRSILFRHINLTTAPESLLGLLSHPLQSITSARVEFLTVTHTRYSPATFNKLLTWTHNDDRHGQMSLSDTLPHLKNLSLNWVGWWTLCVEAKDTLLRDFRGVTHLSLRMTAFDTIDDFLPLIESFPELEILELDGVRPALNWDSLAEGTGTGVGVRKRSLKNLSLKQIEDPRIIRFLVPFCWALEELECWYAEVEGMPSTCIGAIQKVVVAAGDALKGFTFQVEEGSGGMRDGIALDLTHNTNLRALSLPPYHLLPTLELFTKCRYPPGLVSLCLTSLKYAELDWERLDVLLGCHYAFRSVEAICMRLEARTLGAGIGEEVAIHSEIDLRNAMPRCWTRGILRV